MNGQFKKGHKPSRFGKGRGYVWLTDRLTHDGTECLIWPFNRHPTGYGAVGYKGKIYYTHRLMCELVNGPAPSPKHEAAHSCGRGHEGCVHPKHLSWKTRTENQRDRHRDGSNRGWRGRRKLTAEQVAEIIRLKDTQTKAALAERFGVTRGTVYMVQSGETWARRQYEFYSDEDIAYLARELNQRTPHRVLAAKLGRSRPSIERKARELRRAGLVTVPRYDAMVDQ